MNNKTISHIFLLTVFALLVGCTTGIAIETDAEMVLSTAAAIADFDLPTGYHADFSGRYETYVIASFRPDDDHRHLYLVQAEDAADGEKLAAALEQLVPGSSDHETRTRIIETRPVVIRGQSTNLIVSEGTNSDGDAYRQAMATFEGKGGHALFVFSSPVSTWDQEAVDALLASIH